MSKRFTKEIFVKKAEERYGEGAYDYSLVTYINSRTPVTIICSVHGPFQQKPGVHLHGAGCPFCLNDRCLMTTEKFIAKAAKKHNNFYDYSKVDYINAHINVKIICPIHGEFEQKPHAHLNGQGCIKCFRERKRFTTEQWIENARKVHSDKFDYSRVKYIDNKTNVIIICPEHGEFIQNPNSHLRGIGCSKCSDKKQLTTETFIQKARKVHGDKYDYSKVEYKNAYSKVPIICPKHGIFYQIPNSHLIGKGCSDCGSSLSKSKGEKELCRYIKSVYLGKVLENTRKFIGRKELDIYLPELKLAFEYNGEYYHDIHEKRNPGYHEEKRKACKKANITMIEIWENDWRKDQDKIKTLIKEIIEKANIGI